MIVSQKVVKSHTVDAEFISTDCSKAG
jgi:hypothetical protein